MPCLCEGQSTCFQWAGSQSTTKESSAYGTELSFLLPLHFPQASEICPKVGRVGSGQKISRSLQSTSHDVAFEVDRGNWQKFSLRGEISFQNPLYFIITLLNSDPGRDQSLCLNMDNSEVKSVNAQLEQHQCTVLSAQPPQWLQHRTALEENTLLKGSMDIPLGQPCSSVAEDQLYLKDWQHLFQYKR